MDERGDPSKRGDLPTLRGSPAADEALPESAEPTLSGPPSASRRSSVSGEFQSVHALTAGARVGHFVLERKLGEGGMGLVFLAHDAELERKVAVKVLRLDRGGADDASARQRMLREARAMAMLSHPNLVTIYEVGTLAGNVFIAMEYVTGQPLHEWLEKQRSVEDILSVFDQAGRGLGAMHDAGLVHRDFKPANVVVTDEGLVKVLDLGIARRHTSAPLPNPTASTEAPFAPAPGPDERLFPRNPLDQPLTRDGAIVGTPSYMPLEQILGEATSPASDQFAFAVALFEALAGEKPFPGHEQLELLKQVLSEDRRAWPPESLAPPELRAAIDRALSLYPEQRFESMAAFLDACWAALGQSARGAPSVRRRPSDPLLPAAFVAPEPRQPSAPAIDLQSSRQDSPFARWLLGAGLVLVSVGLGVALHQLDERNQESEARERAELEARLAALRGRVETVFARAEQNMLAAYDLRDAWLPLFDRLGTSESGVPPEAERELPPSVAELNELFRPVLERAPNLRLLGLARDDGLAVFVLAPSGEQPRARWSRSSELSGRTASAAGPDTTPAAWFRGDPRAPAHIAWTDPYQAHGTAEPSALGSITWNQASHRYALAVALALTDLSTTSSQLSPAGFLTFLTSREHRVLAPPKHSPDDVSAAALMLEPRDQRTLWRFEAGNRTLWAGRTFIDRPYPTLTVYAVQQESP